MARARITSSLAKLKSIYSGNVYNVGGGGILNNAAKKKIKRIDLPTHYLEVNYKIMKAVMFYQPNIAHIPHGINKKDLNLLLSSASGRGQNI